MARIVIAGCGDVGTAAGLLLVADGHEVFGIRRSSGPIAPGIHAIAADLTRPATLAELPAGVDVLIYVASADGFTDDAYQRAYVTGLGHVLAALRGSALTRVIFVSSTSVFAQDDGGWVDEQSPTQPTGFSGRRLLEAEALVAALDCVSVSVRFAGIYGPGRTRLIEQVRACARCRQDPVLWTNRIHRDDCAAVLRHLVRLAEPQPVYIGVDNEPSAQCEVMRWLARQLDAPAPTVVDADDDGVRRRRGGNKRCSNRRLLDSGYEFVHPDFRHGYGAVLTPLRDP